MSQLESLALDSLDLNDGVTYRLHESLDIQPPSKRFLWIAGREGDILGDAPGSERREVVAKVRVWDAASMDSALTKIGAITDKLQKAERTNGGISLVWTPAGSTYSKTIKVLAGEVTGLPVTPQGADAGWFKSRPVITIRLYCKPFLYGSETSYATVTSSNPHVVAMARSVAGDVSAEGRLILTDMASQERDFAEWGLDPDPITLDALALSYTPSLLLKLGSSGGLTDQSGNGYNGTAQGGVTVGGATSLLTGDDAAATDFDGSNDYISTTYTTRRNLCVNPSVEVDATNWAHNRSATQNAFARSTSVSQYGSASLQCSATGTGAGQYSIAVNTLTPTSGIAVVAGTTYTFSAYVFPGSTGAAGGPKLWVEWYTSGGAFVSSSSFSSAAAGGGFNRISITGAAPATAAFAILNIGHYSGASNALANGETGNFFMDGMLFEAAASAGDYFDGSGYVNSSGTWVSDPGGKVGWLGTAHASASDKGCFANGTVRTFTGVAWRDTNSSYDAVFGGNQGANVPRLYLDTGGQGANFNADTGSGAVVVGTWPGNTVAVHWALVFDEPNNLVTLYLNGVSQGAVAHSVQYSAGVSLAIGLDNTGGNFWDGKMQDFAVYEYGLTADQIRQLYQASANPYLFDSVHLSISGLSGTANTRSGAYNPTGSATQTVIRGSTSPNWVGLCETGALPHYGPFRGKVRLWTDATDAQVRLAYKVGDAPFKRLNPVVLAPGSASAWQEVDLGMVDIAVAATGTQKTVLRVEFKATTAAMTFDIDYLELIPATRYGKARAPGSVPTPSVFSALSNFTTESGAITGDSLAIGGVWTVVANSDTTDYDVTAGVMTRTATSDTGTGIIPFRGRGISPGSTTYAASVVQMDFKTSVFDTSAKQGVFARLVDSSNHLTAYYQPNSTSGSVTLHVQKTIAGSAVSLDLYSPIQLAADTFYTLRLIVFANGVWRVEIGLTGLSSSVTRTGYSSDLATGGTLASGRLGIVDEAIAATAITRTYANFSAWTPDNDAAIFSGKTLEFRYDDTLRQDSGGTIYGRPSIARGPGVFIPQAGSESKVSRIVAKACRNDIEAAPRDNIADSLKLEVRAVSRSLVTPR